MATARRPGEQGGIGGHGDTTSAGGAKAGEDFLRSYSADSHTFNLLIHHKPELLFLCLSDETSTTRDAFHYLEVIA